jgi:hypothetical protein
VITKFNDFINESLRNKIVGKDIDIITDKILDMDTIDAMDTIYKYGMNKDSKYDELIKKILDKEHNNNTQIELIIMFYLDHKFLPRNDNGVCVYEGDLELSHMGELILPSKFTVNGSLNCEYSILDLLPDDLTVNGDLNCNGIANLNRPKNLIVGGRFLNNRRSNENKV